MSSVSHRMQSEGREWLHDGDDKLSVTVMSRHEFLAHGEDLTSCCTFAFLVPLDWVHTIFSAKGGSCIYLKRKDLHDMINFRLENA